MRTYSKSSAPLLSRLVVLPGVVGLVSASVIFGYASNNIWPSRHPVANTLDAPVQMARLDTQGQVDSNGSDATSDAANQANDPISNYKTALALIQQSYYGPPVDAKKTRQLTYDAIRGLLNSLRDQFTSFLDPSGWKQMQFTTKGDYEGIGAWLNQDWTGTGPVIVQEPIEGGPAEKVGVKADDIIARVDGHSVLGKDINDVVRLIQGPHGTKVRIGVLRGKTPYEFVITRARVEPPVVKYWMEDPKAKIGHVVLKEFNEKSVAQMNHAFADLQRQGMRGLVFDLRSNPGGLLETAIDVTSIFVPQEDKSELKNVVVYIHEGSGREQGRTLHDEDTVYKPVPMVVLVNDFSASASEIVAGAIKDYGIGTLLGERTFGKGRVQTLFPLEDGSALRLTTALYYPPLHHDINFQRDEDGNKIPNTGGIVPDIEVKQPPKWKDFKDKVNDTQLHQALIFLRAKLDGMNTAQATDQVKKAH